jgi:hypothetical protein
LQLKKRSISAWNISESGMEKDKRILTDIIRKLNLVK